MINCVHPGSCRLCFFSSHPELFDAACTLGMTDEEFDRVAAGEDKTEHFEALRTFRKLERAREAFYAERERKRH